MSTNQLKDELESRGLPLSGTKTALISALVASFGVQGHARKCIRYELDAVSRRHLVDSVPAHLLGI